MAKLVSKWREGLARTSKSAFAQIISLLGASEINDQTWDDLEGLLIQADLGIETATSVLNSLKQTARAEGITRASELMQLLRNELLSRLDRSALPDLNSHPTIILVVGVNGSGKTTTIAKLASRFVGEGRTVLLGAADTFRAAAVDQLQAWGERLGVDVITGAAESDPGAVAFNTVEAGVARKM